MAGDLQAIRRFEGWVVPIVSEPGSRPWLANGVDEMASCKKHDTCAANRQLQDVILTVSVDERSNDKET